MNHRASAYRWLFLVLPLYAAFAFGRSSWPLAAAFASVIVVYNVTLGLAERRWPSWTRSRVLFLRCVEIGLACIGLSLIYLKGQNADLFEFYYDGFYAVPVILATSAAGRRGLIWSVLAATAAVTFGQVVLAPHPDVVWAGFDYWAGVGAYTGIYAVFFATVGGLSLFVRDYSTREQRSLVLQLARSFGGLRDAVLILDPYGRVMSLNPAAESLFGCKVYQIFSQPVDELCPGLRIVDEEGRGIAHAEPLEITVRRGSRVFPCEILVSSYRLGEEIAAYVVIARDLSGRRRIERELAQQGRLATLGRMTSGLAHDVENPLAGIRGLADVLLMEERPEHEAEALGMIRDEADRVAKLLRGVLEFARADRAPREVVELNEVVERAMKLRAYVPQDVEVRVHRDLSEPSPRVVASAAQLEQIVLNLLTNAEQALASKGGGDLYLRTRAEADSAILEVEDSGPGIPSDFIERIFDPFFTTKGPGEGTGLGLALAREIAQEHGGELRVRNIPRSGACFTVRLPAHAGDGRLVASQTANMLDASA